MPLGEAEQDGASSRKAPPTAISQPVRGSSGAGGSPARMPTPLTSAKPEQPAGLPAERGVQQAQRPGGAAEHVAARRRPGPPACPSTRPRPLYSKISDRTRLSLVPGHPRPVGRRGQFDERRPRPAHEHHRGPAGEQLTQRVQPAARRRGDPQPGGGDARDDDQRHAHLRLEAQPHAHAGEHQPARAPVLQRPHRAPQRRHAAEHQQRVGVVVARDRRP